MKIHKKQRNAIVLFLCALLLLSCSGIITAITRTASAEVGEGEEIFVSSEQSLEESEQEIQEDLPDDVSGDSDEPEDVENVETPDELDDVDESIENNELEENAIGGGNSSPVTPDDNIENGEDPLPDESENEQGNENSGGSDEEIAESDELEQAIQTDEQVNQPTQPSEQVYQTIEEETEDDEWEEEENVNQEENFLMVASESEEDFMYVKYNPNWNKSTFDGGWQKTYVTYGQLALEQNASAYGNDILRVYVGQDPVQIPKQIKTNGGTVEFQTNCESVRDDGIKIQIAPINGMDEQYTIKVESISEDFDYNKAVMICGYAKNGNQTYYTAVYVLIVCEHGNNPLDCEECVTGEEEPQKSGTLRISKTVEWLKTDTDVAEETKKPGTDTSETENPEPVSFFTVVYTDGVSGEIIFPDQGEEGQKAGDPTPAFAGDLSREGYTFMGWKPTVNPVIAEDDAVDGVITYTATWKRNATSLAYVVNTELNNGTELYSAELDIANEYIADERSSEPEFRFEVWLYDADGAELTENYTYTGSRTGTVTSGDVVYLSDGEYIDILNLPENGSYCVIEHDTEGFELRSKSGATGIIVADEIAEAAFVNQEISTIGRVMPSTGGSGTSLLVLSGLYLMLGAGLVLTVFRLKAKEES